MACSNDDKEHVDAVQHLVTAELRDVHVTTMRVYADDKLEITGELLKVFQQLENQSEYHIRSISACLLYTSPSPRDKRQSRMPSSA